jgi:hypothetical protein
LTWNLLRSIAFFSNKIIWSYSLHIAIT